MTSALPPTSGLATPLGYAVAGLTNSLGWFHICTGTVLLAL